MGLLQPQMAPFLSASGAVWLIPKIGLGKSGPLSPSAFAARFRAKPLRSAVVRSGRRSGLGYGHRQFRIRRGDGQLRHIEAVDTVRTGAKDQAEWVVGTNIDITERKLAEDTLRASEERLRLAADVAGIGRGDINYLQDTITLDDRAAALFGMPAGKALPRRDVHARFHPDDIPAIEAKISDSLDPSGSGFMSIDHRTIRPDGSMVWISACKQIEFSARDDLRQRRAVSGILAVLDITARKEHERQIELLMREVNHRSKNMLGVVQAVARQTAKSSPDEFVQRFSERIQALAASQDLLVNSNWRGASLTDLVRVQLAHFKDLVGGRIELRGEPIQLSAPAAQTIGMALHELATNAGKYGSLSNAAGRVMIAWHITKEPAGKRFEMSWTEDGGPPVVAPKRQGFGSTVIDTMAKNGMSGDVVVAFDREGFKWRLGCPAAALW